MKLFLIRETGTDGFTAGNLFIDGVHECCSLEDEIRPVKIQNITAIPCGTYQVIITMSARFKKRLPLLLNVPGFAGIRIHSGNTALDTSGCILVGSCVEDEPGVLTRSLMAMHDLQTKIQAEIDSGEEIWITIINAD